MSDVDFVILPLRPADARKLGATHGAYNGDNVVSLSLAVFKKRYQAFLEAAFGEGQ